MYIPTLNQRFSLPTGWDSLTGRGRFQSGRGLTFFYFEWLNSLKLATKILNCGSWNFFSNICYPDATLENKPFVDIMMTIMKNARTMTKNKEMIDKASNDTSYSKKTPAILKKTSIRY